MQLDLNDQNYISLDVRTKAMLASVQAWITVLKEHSMQRNTIVEDQNLLKGVKKTTICFYELMKKKHGLNVWIDAERKDVLIDLISSGGRVLKDTIMILNTRGIIGIENKIGKKSVNRFIQK
jgi:hypothetical protein